MGVLALCKCKNDILRSVLWALTTKHDRCFTNHRHMQRVYWLYYQGKPNRYNCLVKSRSRTLLAAVDLVVRLSCRIAKKRNECSLRGAPICSGGLGTTHTRRIPTQQNEVPEVSLRAGRYTGPLPINSEAVDPRGHGVSLLLFVIVSHTSLSKKLAFSLSPVHEII